MNIIARIRRWLHCFVRRHQPIDIVYYHQTDIGCAECRRYFGSEQKGYEGP